MKHRARQQYTEAPEEERLKRRLANQLKRQRSAVQFAMRHNARPEVVAKMKESVALLAERLALFGVVGGTRPKTYR